MSPGVTKQSVASITRVASGSLPDLPTPEIRPLVMETQPPAISLRWLSTVATSVALRMRRSDIGVNEFATRVALIGILLQEKSD
jgi:hypothetical protein